MDPDITNRMATTRTRRPGRPPKDAIAEPIPAQPLGNSVPPIICPGCGRGMAPKVLRTKPDGIRVCECTLNGCRFDYIPPLVRKLS